MKTISGIKPGASPGIGGRGDRRRVLPPVWAGYALAAMFVFLSANRDVGIQEKNLPSYFLVLLAFFPTATLAAVAGLADPWPPTAKHQPSKGTRYILALNLTTLVSWATFLESLRLVSADLCAAIVVGGMPICLLLLQRYFDGRVVFCRDIFAALLVAAGVGLMAHDSLTKWPGQTVPKLAAGILLAVISCIFSVGNNWLVGRLGREQVGPLRVFATRFWLLLLVALGIGICLNFADTPATSSDWAFAVMVGFIGVALPLFFNQASIFILGPAVPTLLAAFHPACVRALQLAFWAMTGQPAPPGVLGFAGLITVTTGIIWGAMSALKYARTVQLEAERNC